MSSDESRRRELVFGVVAPLGVDKGKVLKVLRQSLSTIAGYEMHEIKISALLQDYAARLRRSEEPRPCAARSF